jgi:hypothetical protein
VHTLNIKEKIIMSEVLRQQELLRKAECLYAVTPSIQGKINYVHIKKDIFTAILAFIDNEFKLVRIIKADPFDKTSLLQRILKEGTVASKIALKEKYKEEDFNFDEAQNSLLATNFLEFKSSVDEASATLLGYAAMNFAEMKHRIFRDHLFRMNKRVRKFKQKYPTTPVYGWHKVFANRKFAAVVPTPLGNMIGPEGDKYVELPESIGNMTMADLWETGYEGVKNLLNMELIKVMPIAPETMRVCNVFLNRFESWLNYHAAKCYIKRIESVGGKVEDIPAWSRR